MSGSGEYRRFAAECIKIAQATEDSQRQAVFLKMAEVWLELARKAEITSPRAVARPGERAQLINSFHRRHCVRRLRLQV